MPSRASARREGAGPTCAQSRRGRGARVRRTVLGCSAFVIGIAALAAGCASGPHAGAAKRGQGEDPARAEARSRVSPIQIDDTFQLGMADGCTYRARLGGQMRRLRPSRRGEMYAPDLQIEAWLYCPTGLRGSVARRVHGGAMTETQVERELERLGEVVVFRPGLSGSGNCIYSPDFVMVNGRPEERGVRVHCPPGAFGGGP